MEAEQLLSRIKILKSYLFEKQKERIYKYVPECELESSNDFDENTLHQLKKEHYRITIVLGVNRVEEILQHLINTKERERFESNLALLPIRLVKSNFFSNYLKNVLKNNYFDTLGDVTTLTVREFIQVHGIGKKSLTEMENLLKEHNLSFAIDE